MSRNTEYKFLTTDTDTLIALLVSTYEALTSTVVKPSSPERLFIQWMASIIIQERVANNYTGNQNIPSRAEGTNLEALGELFYEVSRPTAQAASATERFTITEAQSTALLIPQGTRVTDANAALYWATTEDVYVAIGDTYVDVTVECQTAGESGNGYAIGQLNTIVDTFAYFSTCSNTTVSDGGSDEATDDEYYELLRASMDAQSTAGAVGSYEYWAKTVSTSIADVVPVMPIETYQATLTVYANSSVNYCFLGGDSLDTSSLEVYPHGSSTAAVLNTDYTIAYSNGLLTITLLSTGALASETQIDVQVDYIKAGYVYLYILMDDGSLASTTIKNLVLAACNSDEVRPLTDRVSCHDATQVTYNINFTYYVPRNTTKSQTEMTADVTAAVNEYVAWQNAKFGRDINPDKLRDYLYDTGIKRVVMTSPTFTVLNDGSDHGVPEVAKLGTTTIINGGYEDE